MTINFSLLQSQTNVPCYRVAATTVVQNSINIYCFKILTVLKLTKVRNSISAGSALDGDTGGLGLDSCGGHNDARNLDQLGHSLAGQVTQCLTHLSAA